MLSGLWHRMLPKQTGRVHALLRSLFASRALPQLSLRRCAAAVELRWQSFRNGLKTPLKQRWFYLLAASAVVAAAALAAWFGPLHPKVQPVTKITTPPVSLTVQPPHMPSLPPLRAPRPVQSAPWPVLGPVQVGFGWVMDPVLHGGWIYHGGWDIGAPVGTPVITPFGGVVTNVSDTAVTLKAGDTSWDLAGLGKVEVQSGQRLPAGALVGKVGPAAALAIDASPHVRLTIDVSGAARSPAAYLNPSGH